MQFVDLRAQQERIRGRINERIRGVLDHGRYILGPEVTELEEVLARYARVPHAVACSSGTDALLLALMAQGVKPGDAVFTSPFTFIATAEVIFLLGATPVFVDIDPATFNLDPAHLEKAVEAVAASDVTRYPLPAQGAQGRLKPRGIIGVDLFGLAADYERINSTAAKHGLFVVEDAAQSLGGEYRGNRNGGLASVGCTSFFPAKPLGGYGDGGMCFTHDDRLAELLRSLCVHGKGHDKYDNVRIGINGRLDTLQAAVLLAKFEIFQEEIDARQTVARRYTEGLEKRGVPVISPRVPDSCRSAWAQYSVLAESQEQRAALQNRLKGEGVPTAVYYPKPLHLQTAFAGLGYKEGDFPMSEDCSRRIFSLPMHPYLKPDEQDRVVDVMAGLRPE